MSTQTAVLSFLSLMVVGAALSVVSRVAARLLIVTAVLGGLGTITAVAGKVAGKQATSIIESVREQAAQIPGASGLLSDPATSGARDVVERVIDGDTVELQGAGRARLIGIDTPETVKPNHPVECHGPQASRAAKELMPEGSKVIVKHDKEKRDRYGRALVYLFSADGRMVNATLVRQGHARTLRIEPNTRHARKLADLQADAKRARRGLWEHCR